MALRNFTGRILIEMLRVKGMLEDSFRVHDRRTLDIALRDFRDGIFVEMLLLISLASF